MNIDWDRTRAITLGIAMETTGRLLGLLPWFLALWLIVAVIVGSAEIVGWIGAKL